MVTNNFRTQYNEADLEKVLDWERQTYQRDAQPIFMLEAVSGEDIETPQDEVPTDPDMCCVCDAELDGEEDTDYITCAKCTRLACWGCCGPVFARECQNCQVQSFLDAHLVGVRLHVPPIAEGGSRPAPFTGERGDAPPGERGDAPPGISGTDLAIRLANLGSPSAPPATIPREQIMSEQRQQQINAYAHARPPPTIVDATQWTPPYAYTPFMTNASPAIFTHPRYTPDFQFEQMPMDPPIAPEAVSARTGVPLVRPVQADNRYVCEMVDQIHRGAPFRAGYDLGAQMEC